MDAPDAAAVLSMTVAERVAWWERVTVEAIDALESAVAIAEAIRPDPGAWRDRPRPIRGTNK